MPDILAAQDFCLYKIKTYQTVEKLLKNIKKFKRQKLLLNFINYIKVQVFQTFFLVNDTIVKCLKK